MGKKEILLRKMRRNEALLRSFSHIFAVEEAKNSHVKMNHPTGIHTSHKMRGLSVFSSYKMPESNVTIIAHFLKGNLKSVPSHSLFPNPGLCLVTYTINKAVAFIEINREMCGDKARELVGKRKDRESLGA